MHHPNVAGAVLNQFPSDWRGDHKRIVRAAIRHRMTPLDVWRVLLVAGEDYLQQYKFNTERAALFLLPVRQSSIFPPVRLPLRSATSTCAAWMILT